MDTIIYYFGCFCLCCFLAWGAYQLVDEQLKISKQRKDDKKLK